MDNLQATPDLGNEEELKQKIALYYHSLVSYLTLVPRQFGAVVRNAPAEKLPKTHKAAVSLVEHAHPEKFDH